MCCCGTVCFRHAIGAGCPHVRQRCKASKSDKSEPGALTVFLLAPDYPVPVPEEWKRKNLQKRCAQEFREAVADFSPSSAMNVGRDKDSLKARACCCGHLREVQRTKLSKSSVTLWCPVLTVLMSGWGPRRCRRLNSGGTVCGRSSSRRAAVLVRDSDRRRDDSVLFFANAANVPDRRTRWIVSLTSL